MRKNKQIQFWYAIKKINNLERNQINEEIKKLQEKDYFQKLLNERRLLLKLLVEELLILKKKYNVKKNKSTKNIDQNEELVTINNQILEDFINKKTKLCRYDYIWKRWFE